MHDKSIETLPCFDMRLNLGPIKKYSHSMAHHVSNRESSMSHSPAYENSFSTGACKPLYRLARWIWSNTRNTAPSRYHLPNQILRSSCIHSSSKYNRIKDIITFRRFKSHTIKKKQTHFTNKLPLARPCRGSYLIQNKFFIQWHSFTPPRYPFRIK